MTVAEANGNKSIALKMQNNAVVPRTPLHKSKDLLCPQGEMPSLLIIRCVIKRLMRALARTISATGMRPAKCLTQTVIKLNAAALAKSALQPFPGVVEPVSQGGKLRVISDLVTCRFISLDGCI